MGAVLAAQPLRRGLGRLGLGMALICMPALLWADTGSATALRPDITAWASRVRAAALDRSFEGTLTYTAGGVNSSSRLSHICEGDQRYERLEVLDGQARVRYGHNDRILTVWPATQTAVAEAHAGPRGFPRLPELGRQLAQVYELEFVSNDRVAGRKADVHLLKPRDGLRFAQRIWTDRESGLLLREDILDARGQVQESTAFSELRLIERPDPTPVTRAMQQVSHLRLIQAGVRPTRLDAEGWLLAHPVPGFELAHCTKRPLDASAEGPQIEILQSVFTDGLAQVSVFIEPYDAARHRRPLRTVMGATHTSMLRQGDWWFTIVGEVPMDAIRRFENALERQP